MTCGARTELFVTYLVDFSGFRSDLRRFGGLCRCVVAPDDWSVAIRLPQACGVAVG
jgi:hypothetical protein